MFTAVAERKQLFFFTLFFSACYFLLLFLTEGFYSLWITPALLLLYGVTAWYLLFKEKTTVRQLDTRVAIGGAVVLLILLALTPWSLSMPASISRWTTLALGGITFLFFFTTPILQKLSLRTLFTSMIVLHALFVLLALFVFVIPGLGDFLPSENLLSFTVGHNHSYILYLISLPLCLYFSTQSKRSWVWLLLGGVFIFGIILSFSRVGLFLLLIELIYFVVVHLHGQRLALLKHLRTLALLCSILVMIYGGLLFLLSFFPQLSYGTNCIVPFWKAQFCKNFGAESRPHYWQQALQGIKTSPILGTGGGTFSILSFRYRQHQDEYSAYPHNEYLQLIVEYGVAGWLIVAAIAISLRFMWQRWHQVSDLARLLIFLSTVTAFDSLFNFNWSFVGIFVLESLLWAVTLKTIHLELASKTKKSSSPRLIFLALLSVGVPLCWLSARFLSAELLLNQRDEEYLRRFPYISGRAERAYFDSQTSSGTKEMIEDLYRNNETLAWLAASRAVSPHTQRDLYQRYLELNPMNHEARVRLMIAATQTNDPKIVLTQLNWLLDFYSVTEKHTIRDIEPQYLERLINYANSLSAENSATAVDVTLLAYQFEPWRINEVQTIFLLQPQKFPQQDVAKLLDSLAPYRLQFYLSSLNPWTWEKMLTAGTHERWADMNLYLKLILVYTDWDPHVVWATISRLITSKLKDPEFSDSAPKKKAFLDAWRNSLETLEKFGTVGDKPLDTSGWSEQIESFAH